MEEEGNSQFYQAPKTAKMFVSTIQNAFAKKDGDKIAKELKDLYQHKLYINVPEKSWNIAFNAQTFQEVQNTLGSTFAKMLQLVR